MSSHIFREYDIRGVADRDLTDDVTRKIGRGLSRMLKPAERPNDAPRIVVARDCRGSGPRLFEALLDGLVSGGTEVIDVGVGPTPLMYFAVHHLDADGGVMITGSHNPADENGFKIMRGKASFFGEDLQKLRELVESDVLAAGTRGSIQTVPVDEPYIVKLRDSVRIEDTTMKVVVDAGNGAAGPLGLRAMNAVGLHPTALFCEMDGAFPNHHPDPTVPENLETLVETVKKEGARVGIAWDGDGDRMGVVDATGEIVWGDRLLALFARDLLGDRPGSAVLGEVKCSQSLFDDIERHGGRPIMWKTGPLADQDQAEGGRRAARRRDERAFLLRRPLLRLRRRNLRGAPPAGDPGARGTQRGRAALRPAAGLFHAGDARRMSRRAQVRRGRERARNTAQQGEAQRDRRCAHHL